MEYKRGATGGGGAVITEDQRGVARRGREPLSEQIAIRLTERERQELQDLVDAGDAESEAALIRRAIRLYLQRRTEEGAAARFGPAPTVTVPLRIAQLGRLLVELPPPVRQQVVELARTLGAAEDGRSDEA
jgi:hypothetical protein